MSNVVTSNPFVIDSPGIICTKPMLIKAVIFVPNAAGNVLQFNQWDEASKALGCVDISGAITDTKTITSTNAFSTGSAGDVIYIFDSDGAAANIGRRQIESLTSDDAVTIVEDNWTNETGITYSLDIYSSTLALYLPAGASDASPVIYPKDLAVNNLLVHTITAGTAYIYFSEGAYSSIV
jgi:hypothetical protein